MVLQIFCNSECGAYWWPQSGSLRVRACVYTRPYIPRVTQAPDSPLNWICCCTAVSLRASLGRGAHMNV